MRNVEKISEGLIGLTYREMKELCEHIVGGIEENRRMAECLLSWAGGTQPEVVPQVRKAT